MSNTQTIAWAAKFLIAAKELRSGLSKAAAEMRKGKGNADGKAVSLYINEGSKSIYAVRAGLVGVLNGDGIDAGKSGAIISSLDAILKKIPSAKNISTSDPAKLDAELLAWYAKNIKPLL